MENKKIVGNKKMIENNLPKMFEIKRIRKETEHHTTLFFEHEKFENNQPLLKNFKAGQFVMLWLPRVDEKPFTISYFDKKEFGITIEAKGNFTKKVTDMIPGEKLGIRGPFGNGFLTEQKKEKNKTEKVCIIAGGCGIAPVAPLIDHLVKNKKNITIIQGAKTKSTLMFIERFSKAKIEYCTDDNTFGFGGFTSKLFENIISDQKKQKEKMFDIVFTCGPEIMMKSIFEICEKNKINCQASLERYMRCGFGICGACVCGNQRVCKDGPIFDSEKLRNMEDFGKKALLKSGKETTLGEYFSWRCN